MTETDPERRIPVICVHPSGVDAYRIFNPNEWSGASKGIVQSCATEFATLQFGASRVAAICGAAVERCRPVFEHLRKSWGDKAGVSRVACFAQDPELHLSIEGFFSSAKSLLDLVAGLLASERVVGTAVHGFHKDGETVGGKVLNLLERSATSARKATAASISALIVEHKRRWIDGIVEARDALSHPGSNAHQVMFGLQVAEARGDLLLKGVTVPDIGGEPIDRFCSARLADIREFSEAFLQSLKVAEGQK